MAAPRVRWVAGNGARSHYSLHIGAVLGGRLSIGVDIVNEWLYRYDWYVDLPVKWRQVTHRLVKELTAEKFVGLSALHQALAAKDKDGVWDALEGTELPHRCIEVIDLLLEGA